MKKYKPLSWCLLHSFIHVLLIYGRNNKRVNYDPGCWFLCLSQVLMLLVMPLPLPISLAFLIYNGSSQVRAHNSGKGFMDRCIFAHNFFLLKPFVVYCSLLSLQLRHNHERTNFHFLLYFYLFFRIFCFVIHLCYFHFSHKFANPFDVHLGVNLRNTEKYN